MMSTIFGIAALVALVIAGLMRLFIRTLNGKGPSAGFLGMRFDRCSKIVFGIAILLITASLFSGCDRDEALQKRAVKRKAAAAEAKSLGFGRIGEFTYKGHDYIRFGGDSHNSGVVHDPDCHCHK